MASLDTLELATRTPLPQSTSTVHSHSQQRLPVVNGNTSPVSTVPDATAPERNVDDINTVDDDDPNLPRLNESSLPPMDGGYHAWSYLIAAFFVETIVWGFPETFGVFLEDYLSDPSYASQPNANFLLPLIGPISTGIMYCSSPFLDPLITRYPYYRQAAMRIGAVICAGALFGASWAVSVPQLLVLQGVIYAIGGSLLYYPTLSYLNSWFLARRGLATGVVFAGTSTGGVLLPLVIPRLLQRYGSRVVLRWLGVSVGVGLIPGMIWIKPRVPERVGPRPPSRVPSAPSRRAHGSADASVYERVKECFRQRLSWWFSRSSFLVLLAANTVQGFGYYMPLIWLPTYASSLNLDKTRSSLALSLLNAGGFIGRLTFGFLSDKLDPWVLSLGTLISTTLSVFVLWGVCSSNLAGLLSFGLTYGIVGGGWVTVWTGFIKRSVRPGTNERGSGYDDPRLTSTLFGYLMLSRGIGNIFSTPISSVLSSTSNDSGNVTSLSSSLSTMNKIFLTKKHYVVEENVHTGFSVSDHRFQSLIVYVGTCFAASAVIMLVGWGWEVWNFRKTGGRANSRR